jgi:hypothetical protein
MGRTMFFLGCITAILGLYVLPARTLAKNAFWAWLVVIFFFVLALEKNIGQTHEIPVKGIAEDDEAFMADNDEEETYTPKRGNSISRGVVARQYSPKFMFKLLCPAGSAVSICLINLYSVFLFYFILFYLFIYFIFIYFINIFLYYFFLLILLDIIFIYISGSGH